MAFLPPAAQKDGEIAPLIAHQLLHMVDTVYRKGSDYLPSDAEVQKLRPKD